MFIRLVAAGRAATPLLVGGLLGLLGSPPQVPRSAFWDSLGSAAAAACQTLGALAAVPLSVALSSCCDWPPRLFLAAVL